MDPADPDKKEVRRPMNAFLIFCKRHRSMVREKNPNLDNRNVTRILGDLWANLKEDEKMQYTDLAKQVIKHIDCIYECLYVLGVLRYSSDSLSCLIK